MTRLDQILRGLKPRIPNCDWDGCRDKGPYGIQNVTLMAQGEKVWRTIPVVRLCHTHYEQLQRTGRMRLSFHPAEGDVSVMQ